jgi:hypothetical protein
MRTMHVGAMDSGFTVVYQILCGDQIKKDEMGEKSCTRRDEKYAENFDWKT